MYYEINKNYTLSEEKIKEIRETDLTEETFNKVFNESVWWRPSRDKNLDHLWSSYSTPPWFVLFDSLDDETQIIRVITNINPEYHSLNEAGRHIYDPRTGIWKSIDFPDKRFNPSEVCSPRKGYRTGGYWGSPLPKNLSGVYFYFYKIVKGVTPEKILKKIFQELFDYGELVKSSNYYGVNKHIWLSNNGMKSIISGYGLFEILWNGEYKKDLYNGTSDDKIGLDFLDKHRKSFLLARKWGVNFKDKDTLTLWIDLMKLVKKAGKDKFSPKWIAGDIRKTHDYLVDYLNKKERERQRKATERYRVFQEKSLQEKLKDNDVNLEYRKKKGPLLEYTIKDGEYSVVPVQDVYDCLQVGLELSNCCYTAGYYEKETSLLLKVYHKDKLKELAEVSIPGFDILQCSGYRNSRDENHDEVLGIIEKWKNKIKEEN